MVRGGFATAAIGVSASFGLFRVREFGFEPFELPKNKGRETASQRALAGSETAAEGCQKWAPAGSSENQR